MKSMSHENEIIIEIEKLLDSATRQIISGNPSAFLIACRQTEIPRTKKIQLSSQSVKAYCKYC